MGEKLESYQKDLFLGIYENEHRALSYLLQWLINFDTSHFTRIDSKQLYEETGIMCREITFTFPSLQITGNLLNIKFSIYEIVVE